MKIAQSANPRICRGKLIATSLQIDFKGQIVRQQQTEELKIERKPNKPEIQSRSL